MTKIKGSSPEVPPRATSESRSASPAVKPTTRSADMQCGRPIFADSVVREVNREAPSAAGGPATKAGLQAPSDARGRERAKDLGALYRDFPDIDSGTAEFLERVKKAKPAVLDAASRLIKIEEWFAGSKA